MTLWGSCEVALISELWRAAWRDFCQCFINVLQLTFKDINSVVLLGAFELVSELQVLFAVLADDDLQFEPQL